MFVNKLLFLDWNPFEWFNDLIQSIVDVFLNLWGEILKALYHIWATLASIIDAIQVIFGMLVGVYEVVWVNNTSDMGSSQLGDVASNNIIISIFTHEYVYGAFIKILILSIFLLVIFTMIAIIKQEYSTSVEKAENNPMEIIKRSVRALVGFLCVPLVCIFGVIASGYLMQALDAATSITGQTLISNKMFAICMQDASRVRTDSDFYESLMAEDGNGPYSLSNYAGKFPNLIIQSVDRNEVAQSIDDCFLYGKALPKGVSFGTDDRFSNFIRNGNGMNDDKFFNTKNPAQVFYYYDLTKFNWLIGFFTIFYIGAVMIRIVLGAAVRLYELAILFVVSPAIISLYPLDKGEALKKWQTKFIGKTTMIFAPVIALNLYFILVATLIQVDFSASLAVALEMEGHSIFTGISGFFLQQIYSIFILIAGLMVCEQSISWLGELIGAEDIDAAGKSLRGAIGDTLQNSASAKYLMSRGAKVKGGLANIGAAGFGAAKRKKDEKVAGVMNRSLINKEAEHVLGDRAREEQEETDAFNNNEAQIAAQEDAKLKNSGLYMDDSTKSALSGQLKASGIGNTEQQMYMDAFEQETSSKIDWLMNTHGMDEETAINTAIGQSDTLKGVDDSVKDTMAALAASSINKKRHDDRVASEKAQREKEFIDQQEEKDAQAEEKYKNIKKNFKNQLVDMSAEEKRKLRKEQKEWEKNGQRIQDKVANSNRLMQKEIEAYNSGTRLGKIKAGGYRVARAKSDSPVAEALSNVQLLGRIDSSKVAELYREGKKKS